MSIGRSARHLEIRGNEDTANKGGEKMNPFTIDWNAMFLAIMVALAILGVCYFLGKEPK